VCRARHGTADGPLTPVLILKQVQDDIVRGRLSLLGGED
jgi:hypothetical protein